MVNCQKNIIILSCETLSIHLDNIASHPMVQKKNCAKRRQENLLKLPPKKPMVSRQPTIKDITDPKSDEFAVSYTPHTLLGSPQGVLGDSTKSLSGVYMEYIKTLLEIYC
jgi:hypothetical protein